MAEKLKLEVILSTINKATGNLNAINKAGGNAAKALKAARDNLKQLDQAQSSASGFQRMNKDLAITRNELDAAKAKLNALNRELGQNGPPTREMLANMQKATREVKALETRTGSLEQSLVRERTALNKANVGINTLAASQDILKLKSYSAAGEIKRQTAELERQAKVATQLAAARAKRDQGMETRNRMADTGASLTGAGIAAGIPILKTVKDYASFETAMLGVARQVDGAKDANGKLTATYYEMGDALKSMSERLPLTAIELAAITEGGARMGIHGKENLLKFTETAATMAAAFDLPVEQLGNDMGQIAGLYKVPISNIRELGDTINFLDDNALSKGSDIIEVMKRIAGQADMVGMSYKDAAALGSTFLSLGAGAEVAATASNAMMTRLSNAPILSSSKRYAEGLRMLGLDAEKLQKNMSTDATGTILKVLEAIRKLPKDKQLEASTRIFGVEYGDDASKLASRIDEYKRQLALAKDAKAKGSMQRESDTRNGTLDNQFIMSMNGITNTSSELGKTLKPAIVDILQDILRLAKGLRDWVKEHPTLVGFIMKTAAVLSVLMVALGGLTLLMATILGPMIMMRYGLAMLGIKGGLAGTALKFLGNVLVWVLKAMLTNPIGLAITGIAVAALLIYKYWEPIKKFFSNLIDGITNKIKVFIDWFKEKTAGVREFLGGGNQSASIVNGKGGPKVSPVSPLRLANAGAGTVTMHAPITVHAAPGMDEKQLAKHVATEFEKRHQAAATRSRSRLTDRE